jgi:hypothetical protein
MGYSRGLGKSSHLSFMESFGRSQVLLAHGRTRCGLAAGELTGSAIQRVRSALFKRNVASS